MSKDLTLLRRLREIAPRLPGTVADAVLQDPIAQFSSSPRDLVSASKDEWKAVDKTLNNFLGYGVSAQELSLRIHCGAHGLDSLIRWLDACVQDLGISDVPLEGKIARLIEAAELLYVTISFGLFAYMLIYVVARRIIESSQHVSASKSQDKLVPDHPATVINSPRTASPAPSAGSDIVVLDNSPGMNTSVSSRTSPCRGYLLETPSTHPALMYYPIALETVHILPWTLLLVDGKIYARSHVWRPLSTRRRRHALSALPFTPTRSSWAFETASMTGLKRRRTGSTTLLCTYSTLWAGRTTS